MTTTREQARELAIEAASKDSELHAYTAGARNGEEWQPHAWVVDAVERALRIGHTKLGERGVQVIREIVDQRSEQLDRLSLLMRRRVDDLEARIGALEARVPTGHAFPGRCGPPPGVPDLPDPVAQGTAIRRDPTTDSIAQANRERTHALEQLAIAQDGVRQLLAKVERVQSERNERRERDRNELNKCTIQSDSIAQALGVPLGSREQNTQRSLAAIATLKDERDQARAEVGTLRDGFDRLHDGVRHVLGKHGDAPITTAGIMDVIGSAFEERNHARAIVDDFKKQLEREAEERKHLHARTTAAERTTEQLSEQLRVQAESMAQWERMMRTLLESVDVEHRGEGAFMGAEQTIGRLRTDLARALQERDRLDVDVQRLDARVEELAAERTEARRQAEVAQLQLEKMLSACADQAVQIMELRGERFQGAELQATLERTRADCDARCEEIADVWALVKEPDVYGSPFYREPGLDDTTPAHAVASVLGNLRKRLEGQNRAREAALKGCDTLSTELTKAHRETRDAQERAGRAERNATQLATRVRDLEGQLERRNKLDATRLQETDDLRMRIVTIADEKFGPFPVMGADHALTAIADGIWHLQRRVDIGSKLHDRCCEAIAGSGSLVAAIKEYDDSWKAAKEQREQRETEFLRSIGHGAPEPDDCQAGTCDCPKLPLEAKESDPGAQLDDQHGFPTPADPSNGKH